MSEPHIFAPYFDVAEPFRRLENVYITMPGGIILKEDGSVLWSTMNEQIQWRRSDPNVPRGARRADRATPEGREELKRRQDAITASISGVDLNQAMRMSPHVEHLYFCHSFGWHAYGHIFDSFQRLYNARNHRSKSPIVITSDFRRISGFLDHMKIWGYQSHQVFTFSSAYQAIFVPKLILGELQTKPGGAQPDMYEYLRQIYLFDNETIDTSLRIPGIYLDRNSTRSGRGVTNNDEVRDYLISKDYVIVDGSEPLQRTLQLFHSALKVIGAHGGAFSNTVFCNADAEIYEFMPETQPFPGFLRRPKLTDAFHQIKLPADADKNVRLDMNMIREIA